MVAWHFRDRGRGLLVVRSSELIAMDCMDAEPTRRKPIWPLGLLVALAVGLIALQPSAILGPWSAWRALYLLINVAVFGFLVLVLRRARRMR